MSYKNGSSQPVIPLLFSASQFSNQQINHINHIVSDIFDINFNSEFLVVNPSLELSLKAKSNEWGYIKKQIILSSAIAQKIQSAAGYPSFSAPHILSCAFDKPTKSFKASLLVPYYRFSSLKIIKKSFTLAQKSMSLLAKGPNYIEEVHKILSKDLILKLKRDIFFSKSTAPILKAAHAQQIPIFHLGQGIFQLGSGSKSRLLDKSSLDLDSMVGARISQNKLVTKKIIGQLGFPTPRAKPISSIEDAALILNKWQSPVVIKPQNADRGEGVTLNIKSTSEIPEAFKKAKSFSQLVMIEEMCNGLCHRIVVANEQLVFAVKRHPMYVTGDGIHSVKELIELTNKKTNFKVPFLRKNNLTPDKEMISFLDTSDVNFHDIISKGRRIYLRPTESSAWGGISEEATEKIHPANSQLAIQVVKSLRLNICGLDFMTEDISVPWYENGGKILESNFSPLLATTSELGQKNLKDLLNLYFKKGSRITHHIFVGNDLAILEAKNAHLEEIKLGKKAYLIQNEVTLNPGQEIYEQLIDKNVYDRWYSLLINPEVDSIIIHLDNDSIFDSGLPIDQIEKITIVNEDIKSVSRGNLAPANAFNQLRQFLSEHLIKI